MKMTDIEKEMAEKMDQHDPDGILVAGVKHNDQGESILITHGSFSVISLLGTGLAVIEKGLDHKSLENDAPGKNHAIDAVINSLVAMKEDEE